MTTMSNSSLVSYTKISPNKTKRTYRSASSNGKISKITIHHMAGCISVESCGSWFAQSAAKCSSNYGIDSTGKIALYVPEDYRSWCSSNADNDNIAITIEIANSSSGGNWPVSDKALAACIDLCVDICRRNGIAQLNYTGTTSGNLTRHDMFCNKVCPGPYLGGKFPYIVSEVNKRLINADDITALSEKPDLSYDDDNTYVSKAQELLMKLGYDLGVKAPTGYFGSNTLAAVKKFQADNGIEQTGNIAKKTWAALFLLTMDITAETDKPELKQGAENEYVFKAQGLLMKLGYPIGVTAPTGYFGTNTLAAVKQFQTANGLTADGVIGPVTWGKLFSDDAVKYVAPAATPTSGKTASGRCTAAQAVAAMEYWIGYYEKASSSYATTRDKTAFSKNSGSNNYTYAGYLCGVQGQPWCAAQVSTAIYEACGNSKALAKEVMYGVWPYVSCNQVWDASGSVCYWSHYQRNTLGKGARGTYYPEPGDIIIFTNDKTTRSHTGMVYACDKTYVYTIEGNSGNMCRKRSYLLTSSYIYGWVRPKYDVIVAAEPAVVETQEEPETEPEVEATPAVQTVVEQYGEVCCKDPELHVLSKGVAGPEVKTIQRIIAASKVQEDISIDGDFGVKTEAAVKLLQEKLGLEQTGKVDAATWAAALKKLD